MGGRVLLEAVGEIVEKAVLVTAGEFTGVGVIPGAVEETLAETVMLDVKENVVIREDAGTVGGIEREAVLLETVRKLVKRDMLERL